MSYLWEVNSLKGILLSVTKKEISEEKAIIEGSKFRTGKGAIGVRCELIFKDNNWEIKEVGIMWIS